VAGIVARLLPAGNFSLINMVAGVVPVRFRDFLLGNLLGVLPGVLGLSVLSHRIVRVLRNPAPRNVALLALAIAALVALLAWMRRRLQRGATRAVTRSPSARSPSARSPSARPPS